MKGRKGERAQEVCYALSLQGCFTSNLNHTETCQAKEGKIDIDIIYASF